jgi:SAM-dependent methyltransferase
LVSKFFPVVSFDLLAPHYRWMELILAGEKLQRCRTAFLDQISSAQKILLLGEGHGRSLVECHHRFPFAKITCLDASEKMLAQSRRQLARREQNPKRVQFVHADILNWSSPEKDYDLIVTNFFLDCFSADQLEEIVPKISDAAAPDANWLLADFQVAPAGLKRIRSQLILASMYFFFRTVTKLPARRIISPDLFLQNAGFRLRKRVQSEWDLLHADWWTRESAV